MRKRPVLLPVVIAVAVLGWGARLAASGAARFDGELPDAYEIVASVSVGLLPTPIRPLFEARLEAFGAHATAGLESGSTEAVLPGDDDAHFVLLDVAQRAGSDAARRQAALAFPRDRVSAKELARRWQVRHGGTLPWMLEDTYRALTEAMDARRLDEMVREAGYLLHFATDAALPFNTTVLRDGMPAHRLVHSPRDRSLANRWHHNTRQRCQAALVRRQRSRFAYEVRVWPGRISHAMNVRQAVFATLLDSHRAVDALLKVDDELFATLGISDGASFEMRSDAYYERLAELAGPIIESRLEAASLLTAGLIAAAWVEAGSPAASRFIVATQPTVASPASTTESSAALFVGSRHSTVFHRTTCAHVRRIGQDNRVMFATVADAIDAGRTSCKACRPGSP